jgi:hypothetical protein
LKDQHTQRIFKDIVLRGIFGQKKDDRTGDWRKMHNEELHKLHPSWNIMRMIKSMQIK